ncbi:MAG: response regulator [Hyphomicrobiaceae bacterium]
MSSSVKILVLDDNVDVAQGVGEILEMSGYDVTLVHDGESAVSTFCGGQFNLGLFDVRMQGMNGVEAFLEIKRQQPKANILLMSGYAEDDLIKSAFDNGVLGLLSKPFEPDEMLDKVRVFCDRAVTAA